MQNEVQKNKKTENAVRIGLLISVLGGLALVIWGVQILTKDWEVPEEELGPKLTPAPVVAINKTPAGAQKEPEPYSFYVNGRRIEGTVMETGSDESSNADEAPVSARNDSGAKPSQIGNLQPGWSGAAGGSENADTQGRVSFNP